MKVSRNVIVLGILLMLISAFAQSTPSHFSSWKDLDNAVAGEYERLTSSRGSICPPGPYTVSHHSGYFTFAIDSDLTTVTNLFTPHPLQGIQVWSLRVVETQGNDRVWLYWGKDPTPAPPCQMRLIPVAGLERPMANRPFGCPHPRWKSGTQTETDPAYNSSFPLSSQMTGPPLKRCWPQQGANGCTTT